MIRKRMILSAMNVWVLWSAPIFMSISTICVYQYIEQSLHLANILTCITIFNQIQNPIRTLPQILSTFIEMIVSLERLQTFMEQDEIDYKRLERDDIYTKNKGLDIIIENGNFSWGIEPTKEERDEKISKSNNKESSKGSNKESKDFATNKQKSQDESKLILENVSKEPQPIKTILKNINISIQKGQLF